MTNTQGAFLLPAPAPQQISQARPSHRPLERDVFQGDDNHSSEDTSFMAFLDQTFDQNDEPEASAPLQRFLAANGQTPEESKSNLYLPLGDKCVLSNSILDLMVSLKNDLENNSVNLNVWRDKISTLLNEAGLDWNSIDAEALWSKLRHDMHLMFLEHGGAQHADADMLLAGYLKAAMEAQLAGNGTDTSGEASGVSSNVSDAQVQFLADLNYHPHLKQEVSREGSVNVGTIPGDEIKSKEELLSGRHTMQREKQGSNQHQDSSSRSEAQEALALNKDADKTKALSENKTPFGQFFENIMAQRGSANTDAPKMDLSRGFQLSQGDTLNDGLSNVVRFIRADGLQKANLIVDPPALGRISVELISGTAGLEASIKVSSEQIRQLIQDHIAQLRLTLEQQGVQLTHFSVDVQQDNTKGRQDYGEGAHRRHGSLRAGEEDEEELTPSFQVDLNQGLLYWIA